MIFRLWVVRLGIVCAALGCGAEQGRIFPIDAPGADVAPPDPTGTGGTPDPSGSGGDMVDPGTGGAGTGGTPDPGSGGAAGDAGSGGAGGTGMPEDGSPSQDAMPSPYVCNHLIGLYVASQWWPSFESGMDTKHWQMVSIRNAYLELWADASNGMWTTAKTAMSPCTVGAQSPDRVLFIVFSRTLASGAEYQANLNKVVANIESKFPGVKRIELLTTVRSPGNTLCQAGDDPFTVVPDYVDQAIKDVADQSGGLVTVGPKIALSDCAWWQRPSTDLFPPGPVRVGELYADYYQTHL